MNFRQFKAALRRSGPALDRWPHEPRAEARDLLAGSWRARRRYLAALRDDTALDAPLDPAVHSRLTAAVQARIAAEPRLPSRWHGRVAFPMRWGALAACALLGIWAGMPGPHAGSAPSVLAALQMTALDQPWPEDAP